MGGPPAGGFGGAPSTGTNGLAVGALVVGIGSLLLFWACFLGILGGIIAIVLGVMGRSKAQRENGNGSGMATAGIVTGGLALVANIVLLVALTVFGNSVDDSDFGINTDTPDGVCDEDRFLQDPDC